MNGFQDLVILVTLIVLLLVMFVVGLWYTVRNCQRLMRTMRQRNDGDGGDIVTRQVAAPRAMAAATTAADREFARHARTSSQASHEQLQHELQSMQQLQMHVTKQLVEIQSALSQYAAMQQRENINDEQKQD